MHNYQLLLRSCLLPNEDYLVKVLEACEEELVCELSSVNAVEMCKAFFQACMESCMSGAVQAVEVAMHLTIKYQSLNGIMWVECGYTHKSL